MGRRHAIAAQEEGGGGGGFGRDEELLVIRFHEVLNWKRNRGVERELNPRLVRGRHHVVLAPPRALLDDRAHVSCWIFGDCRNFCLGYLTGRFVGDR